MKNTMTLFLWALVLNIFAQNNVPPYPDSFDISPAVSSIVSGDCATALTLCSPLPFSVPDLTDPGSYDPVEFTSCLVGGEHQTFWFNFTFQSAGTFEFLATPIGLGADLDFALFMGGCPDAGGVQVACNYAGPITPPGPFVTTGISSSMSNAEIIPPVMVQPGVTYYLVIDNITNNGVGFDIEFAGTASMGAGTPAPVCSQAPVVPCACLEEGFNGQTGAPNVTDVPPAFCGSIENEQWISFKACWCAVEIEIATGNSSNGGGVEVQLFAGCGPGFPVKTNCITVEPGTSGFLSNVSCVVGNTYYLLLDGVSGDTCDYTITITEVPSPPVQILQDTIIGPTHVCAGDTVTYLAPPVLNAAHCDFTFDGDSTEVLDPTHTGVTVVFGNESGTLCFIATNCTSFDSVCMFVQVDTATFTMSDSLMICQNELPFDYNGLSIGTAGIYVFDTLQSFIGCDSFLQVFVEILPAPEVEISVSGPVNPGNPVANLENVYFAIPSSETYLWAGPGISASIENQYTPQVTLPGIYKLTVMDTLTGCSVAATAEVLAGLCSSYNLPVPPGDDCASAPLFCGDNLNGFCSNNSGASPDSTLAAVFGCPLENEQWIRFVPCEPVVELTITVGNCNLGSGLEAAVLSGDSCSNFSAIQSCETLLADTVNSFIINSLTPGEIYYLVMDGLDGDACDYRIDVVSGISFDPPVWETLSEGYITGPSPVCVGQAAQYSIVPPECELLSGGSDCPLPPEACPESNDSTALIWHIPTVASFLGDSVNVDTIDIIWNGQPTPGNDSIWVEIIYFPDTTGSDSLVFCACVGSGCDGPINGMTVGSVFLQEFFLAELTCTDPAVEFCGQTITEPGVYSCPINCGIQIMTVTEDMNSEFFDLGVIELCPGDCFELMGNQYCDPGSFTEIFPNPVNGCDDMYFFTLVFITPAPLQTGPAVALCDATNQAYTVGFSIMNGTPPYFVDGNLLNGNFYQSPPIASGDDYAFTVSDGGVCAPQQVFVNGTYICACITSAGTNSILPLIHCESEMAAINYNNDAQLDQDDILMFVLHTNGGNTLGNMLGMNTTGAFGFDPVFMDIGQTYYISPVAGNNAGGTVDLSDVCLSVGAGQPVVFYENPALEILPPDSLNCVVNSLIINTLSSGGSGNFSYAWTGPGGYVSDEANPVIFLEGDYVGTLTDTVTGCGSTASVFIVGDTEPPVFSVDNEELNCNQPEVTLVVDSLAPGAIVLWTLPSGDTISGSTVLTNVPGVYEMTVTASNGCMAEGQAEVTVNLDSPDLMVTNAMLSCAEPEAVLSAVSLTAGVSFNWTMPNGEMAPGATIAVSLPGEYAVLATAPNGCVAADTSLVTGSLQSELIAEFEAIPPTCHGDEDGSIHVLQVSGGTAPYQLFLNGVPAVANTFTDLPAGDYLLMIEDAGNCEGDTLIVLPEPEEVLVDLGDDQIIQLGETVTLEIQTNISPDSIIWNGPNGLVWEDVLFLQIQPTESGHYTATIFDEEGCSATDEVFVFVEGQGQVYVPTAFSPNGDGNNDVLLVYGGKDLQKIISFQIFDRWGERVFADENFLPNDPAHGWDGQFKGKNLKSAVFVFVADVEFINGERKRLTGDVVLMR